MNDIGLQPVAHTPRTEGSIIIIAFKMAFVVLPAGLRSIDLTKVVCGVQHQHHRILASFTLR